jgi:16S rRNA (adenine1518-N6/adenine1519-N6)-dimethyltransferase
VDENLRKLTTELFKKYRISPRKSIGQSFLIDKNTHQKIVDAAHITRSDHVLEIGPGLGFLTEELLQTNCQVTAIEIDEKLAQITQDRFSSNSNLHVILGDAVKVPFPKTITKVVSNLPYSSVSPLLMKILKEKRWSKTVVMVQQEIAKKLQATPGTPQYHYLSVLSNLRTSMEVLFHVPPQFFIPAPEVTSSVVRLTAKAPFVRKAHLPLFHKVAKKLFQYRRKIVRAALKHAYRGVITSKLTSKDILTLPWMTKRVFQLEMSDLAAITTWIKQQEIDKK